VAIDGGGDTCVSSLTFEAILKAAGAVTQAVERVAEKKGKGVHAFIIARRPGRQRGRGEEPVVWVSLVCLPYCLLGVFARPSQLCRSHNPSCIMVWQAITWARTGRSLMRGRRTGSASSTRWHSPPRSPSG
jgi:hypothetical protein